MVHVVDTDVGCEPAQQHRQIIMRAAVQSGVMQVPALVVLPRRLLKLMLHIEQPYTGRGGEQHDRKMHEQERLNTDEPCERGGDQGNGEIGCHCAGPRLPTVTHEADRETVLQEKQISWSDHEHDQRVAVKSVFQTAPPRTGLVFAHCQGIDIADAAPVEVAVVA